MHPLLAGPLVDWPRHLERCREMGFDHLAAAPLFAPGASSDVFLTGDHETVHPALKDEQCADEVIGALAETCRRHELGLMIDLVVDRVAADGRLATSTAGWFRSADAAAPMRLDPRSTLPRTDTAYARFDDPAAAEALTAWWIDRLARLAQSGVVGFRCTNPQAVPPPIWRAIIDGVQRTSPACRFLAWTPGLQWHEITALSGIGFDGVFSSVGWWDGRASWFVEEHELLRQVGSVVACPEVPFGIRLTRKLGAATELSVAYRQMLRTAAATGSGLLIPMGFEFASAHDMDARHSAPADLAAAETTGGLDLAPDIRTANALTGRLAAIGIDGEMRALTGPGSAATALLRSDRADVRQAQTSVVILLNPDLTREQLAPILLDPLPPTAGAALDRAASLEDNRDPNEALAPGEVRLVRVERNAPVKLRRPDARASKIVRNASRIAIERIAPSIDGGRFPAKRVIGDKIVVEADVFMDGHEVLAVELLWRPADEEDWRRERMQSLGNDRWQTVMVPTRIGRHLFTIEAWWDEYASFCRDLEIKRKANADVTLEVEEGRRLLEQAQRRARAGAGPTVTAALGWLGEAAIESSVDILLAPPLRDAMAECDERPFRYRHEPPCPIEVERPQAGFGAWYELFPRSATDDPARHGTFDDVARGLPMIRAMGFDVLYFPPIHPIGTTNRKGRNNSLRAAPGDLGSPYAIGGHEGGHDAIHPALGTIEDFRRLRDAAAAHGLEIALDFAIQCSPDHPWLKAHPGWFRWRPDGSLRFAENPPKKYEDIVNVDFYAEDAIPSLWTALRDVVLYWVDEGVRAFRVDNPHTKPLPFWEWLIADVRARHPDVIFLSEAFTRPKMMYRLAKVGFSQSYTYFTWRNTKRELTDYLTELTTSEVTDYFRPHFFVNTPDINPVFLQTSGRPGFLIRAALAATLSGLWGMYSGFELCEAAPLPGREEYFDSEKYEIRTRQHDAPGNIVAEITMLNRIRKANPALQSHLGLRFYNAFNDQVIYYGKALPAGADIILVAVSLDPHRAHEPTIEIPLWEWGLPDDGAVMVTDLMRSRSFVWHGKLQRIRLDPDDLPFAIWRIAPLSGG